ncbi:uncharacterized protein LOC134269206 [Saccostrea cucullata]|uniref:uncharacterized protein LOC134269206 n=1 Tax=Saccostrea cuccullata TaxID=36930 RepID=UPI002ED3F0D1
MANSSDLLTTTACSVANFSDQMPVCVGEINDQSVQVLRDTGCNGVIVRRSLVHDDQLTGDHQVCVLADGSKIETPVAKVNVDTPYFVGEVNAWCLKAPLYPLIIGNIPHARDPHDPNKDWKPSVVNAVVTRQQKRMEGKKIKPLSVPEIIGSEVCPEDMLKTQEEDETLKNLRALVGKETNGNRVKYILKKGMLFRVFQSEKVENGKQFTQLVVPKKYRMKVLSLAHESLMAGHLATSRTIDKVLAEFYWPGVQADARRFCRSCDICQRTTPKGRTTKVPMSVMPIIDEPFRRVAVDLVGPIQPMTDNGNRYILTLVDFSTRYPEAVALKGIETERVAEALVDIFCRIGVPKEMLTDMGTQFTSELMGEVSRLLSMKQLSTTPYHPMCNGLVERFNGALKQILRRLCSERPKDWDKYLSAALFAYRDAPQESLGFSPFELVYGHRVRGPMRILRELWTKEETDSEVRSTYQYVVDLRERLESTCQLARENLEKSSERYRAHYNKKAKNRDMSVGEKVLVLLPTDSNKLLMQWKGPFEIVKKLGKVDYRIDMNGKIKTFHANMLKLYFDRKECCVDAGILGVASAAMVDVEEDDSVDDSDLIDSTLPTSKEKSSDVKVSDELTISEHEQVKSLLEEYSDVFSDIPGCTTLDEHHIKLTSDKPVRSKPYPLPFTTRDEVCEEVRNMINSGVIEQSNSPYCSPILIVEKIVFTFVTL